MFSFSWACTHAHRTAWGYHPTTKPSISPWLLYHSPMLCLMKFRKNLWPNPHISHLVWDHSQMSHCGRCKQITILQFYQAAELHTVKCIWSFRSRSFSDRHITFRISIYEKLNSVCLQSISHIEKITLTTLTCFFLSIKSFLENQLLYLAFSDTTYWMNSIWWNW